MVDWIELFDSHRIEYVRKGANVARNNVNIHCPFCGDADPSHHMGVSLNGSGWGCWRNPKHRGKSPAKLIQAVLGVSAEQARRLAGQERVHERPLEESVQGYVIRKLRVGGGMPEAERRLHMPESFKPLTQGKFAARFIDYMSDRGFSLKGMQWLEYEYDVRYCALGDYANRIVLPIHDREGRLMGWTARSINKHAGIRYKTLSVNEPRGPAAVVSPKHLVLGLPYLWKMIGLRQLRRLVIVEGPFDAIKVSWLGRKYGIAATCLFGLSMTSEQAVLLEDLIAEVGDGVMLLDPEARVQALSLLSGVGKFVRTMKIPAGVEDPGALSNKTFDFLLEGVA